MQMRSERCLKAGAAFKARFERGEDGSLTILGLFLFIVILFISGIAVDLVRHENERVGVQNALDTAIVAASSLSQTATSEEEVTNLVKQYVRKAGYEEDIVNVTPDINLVQGTNTALSREVSADVEFRVDTMFMNMMGVDSLPGRVAGSAREGQQRIEIALVLDISGSMGSNSKLDNLKTAAKEFVTTVLQNNSPERTTISIIPYNQQVYMGSDLMSRLMLQNTQVTVNGANGGAISSYQTRNPDAPCARFHAADFETRRLAASSSVDVSASFVDDYFYWALNGVANVEYEQPNEFSFWCGSHHPTVLLYQNDETALHTYIDSFNAYGATAIDYGMNWAVGVLDPSFAPIIKSMVDDGLAPAAAEGHPVAFGTADVLKYVVLMTDGQNTDHFDLKDEYKSGPSRIWYSDSQANSTEFNGFLVEMPDNSPSQRWYIPNSPFTTSDDQYVHKNALPADAVQWDYHDVYRRFRTNDVANFFFKHSDAAAYEDFLDVVADVGGYGTADSNLQKICNQATENDYIEVFAVAFEAPLNGQIQLEDCVSKPGNYFDVSGTQISAAFNSIATQISTLRLTE